MPVVFPQGFSRISRRTIFAAALAFAVPLIGQAGAHEFKAGELLIKHPWSRATVPAAKVAGGYLTVVNPTAQADKFVSVTAEIATRTELHEMSMKDGVMSMRAVTGGLDVPANGELALEPGKGGNAGYHLMFLGLKRPLKQGEKFAGTITFEKAGTVNVEFAVEAIGKKVEDHSNHGG